MSPEARARIEQDRREVLRLYGLGNAWLAAALLAAAREAQSAAPQLAPGECTYNARLIWGIVPEVARRLGVVRLTTNEIDWESRELSDYELRVRAGHALKNIGYTILPGWRMLSRDIGNGNVVVFALDRLCPGRLGDREDPIVRNLTELAACRGRPYDGIWTPAMNLSGELDDQGEGEGLVLDAEEECDVVPLRPGA
ncbi:hypothetical protein [Massilia orientalis]|uniref:hypothetical protein n=1 Tax=Massilia orientalis TaxID=3050128 RepID=UPI0037DCC78A